MAQSTQTPPVGNPGMTQGAQRPQQQRGEREQHEHENREAQQRQHEEREDRVGDREAQLRKERDEAIERIRQSDQDRDALAERARSSETDAERQERANRDMKTIRDMAEAATGHLPKAGEGSLPAMNADQVRKEGESMVKMTFDRPVTLTMPDYRTVRFPAGIQEVPESLADDPYLKANGVTRV
jgi:hypothetical protein